MDDIAIEQYAERLVHSPARTLTHPRPGECRDVPAPLAVALERRLGSTQGCANWVRPRSGTYEDC